jgi:hypothetical protein
MIFTDVSEKPAAHIPEVVGRIFIRNVGKYVPDYTVSQPRSK